MVDPNYSKMSKKSLSALAKTKGIKGYYKMNKDDLVSALSDYVSTTDTSRLIDSANPNNLSSSSTSENIVESYKKISPPVSSHYNQDSLFFSPVDPSKHFLDWELSDSTRNKFEKQFSSKSYMLRIVDSKGNLIKEKAIEYRGSIYINLYLPHASVIAQIGIVDKDGNFHLIIFSKEVYLPSDKVSDSVDSSWMLVEDDWIEILDLSGNDSKISMDSSTSLIKKRVRKNNLKKRAD